MRRPCVLALATLSMTACSSGTSSVTARPDGGGVNPCATTDPALATADADGLFGASTIPVFDLYLPDESWQWLKTHATLEQYVQAQACYNGTSVGTVGMRFKGSYGSLYNCFDDAGVNSCRKLGIKLKFDEYVDKQYFFGLKRINFQGYRYDDSYLHERLSYDLYRSMGIVAPRAAWAQVRVNGELQGLFGMVEQPDVRFVKSRFPGNSDSNLYKEAWPGLEDDAALTSHLETNDKEPNVTAMKAFSQALNAAPDVDLRATFAQYMDLAYFARYMAVDDAIANFDGVITYYTNGAADGAGNHNFFLYEESPHLFTIIPWDLESTLSLSSNYGNVPPWQEVPTDCKGTYPVWGGRNRVIAPGCDRVFRALAADLTQYRAAVRTLLDSHFSVESMQAKIASQAAFIRPAAIADPHGPGETAFDNAVGLLKQGIPLLRARLDHLASGAKTIPFTLSTTASNDLEALDAYSLVAGTAQMSNANTTASVALNTATPLSGTKSCRIDFSFGNETKTYQQWSLYKVPMAVQPADLTTFTGIRLKARSNVPRVLRFDIDSPNNSAAAQGIQFGWNLVLDTSVKTFDVLFADAKIPSWAKDPGDSLAKILQTTSGFIFQPQVVGRDGSGQLPAGVTDIGWIDIDDIEFY